MEIAWATAVIAILASVAITLHFMLRSRRCSANQIEDTLRTMSYADTHELARAALESEYLQMWQVWYSDSDCETPAKICFEPNSSWSIYSHKEHEHRINLGERDVDELLGKGEPEFQRAANSPDWPKWKQELVHEMLHEYQYKAIGQQATCDGQQLYDLHNAKFVGQGHGPDYFTAIHKIAQLLNISPEELIKQIR